VVGAGVVGGFAYDSYAAATYSHGWRMGVLFKYSEKSNLKRLFLRSTGEGQVMLGLNSSQASWTGSDGQQQENPWAFSSTLEQVQQFGGLEGRTVAVEYHQIMHRWHAWKGDTDYRLVQMQPIDPTLADAAGVEVKRRPGLRSTGRRVGRLVKVTRKGVALKTWEVTVQAADGGNSFLDMSMLDDEIYEAAIAYLRSGRLLNIGYIETLVRNPLSRDTNYAITILRPVEG